MSVFTRYALYHAPKDGAFADAAAAWLGWDARTGCTCPPPAHVKLPVPISDLTARPRKYGFHGTLRAPFRLAEGLDEESLRDKTAALAAGLSPFFLDGLDVSSIGRFLALCPVGDDRHLRVFASAIVEASNAWRAPLTPDEFAKRRPDRLNPRQRELLTLYGYPHVFDEFRFHMTLTGPLETSILNTVQANLREYFQPVVPVPYRIEDLCLFGERVDGSFVIIDRYTLGG